MIEGTAWLCTTAATIGVVHTLLGPDHYLPFVAMSRAGRWSLRKTLLVTVMCGVGHVLGSIVLGAIGIGIGVAVFRLENIERIRGALAGWMLLAFGVVYFIWGVRRAIRNKPHTHWHGHADGTVHTHEHRHAADHVHAHDGSETSSKPSVSLTPWVLFTIFIFGPCEPFIPVLMVPAAQGSVWGVVLVTFVFALATIVTMTAVVFVTLVSVRSLSFPYLGRLGHALAGIALIACGAAIQFGL